MITLYIVGGGIVLITVVKMLLPHFKKRPKTPPVE